MSCEFLGLIQRSWLSPCGVFWVRKVLPPSVDLNQLSSPTEDGVRVVRIDRERVVVEGAGGDAGFAVDEVPGGAGVVGAVEAGAGLGFDEGVDAVGGFGGDGDVGAAEFSGRQAACEFGPVLAAVGGLVDATVGAAGDDAPGLAQAVPHRGEDDLGMAGLELEVGGAERGVDEEDLLPGFAAVGGLVDAAGFGVRVIFEGAAERGYVDLVGVGGVDSDRADLADVA